MLANSIAVLADRFELVFSDHPLSRVMRIAIWACTVYSVVCAARRGHRPYRRDELSHSLRAAVRALAARARRSPTVSFLSAGPLCHPLPFEVSGE